MKLNRLLLLLTLLLGTHLTVSAQQSNAIVFTENGERFTLILNGLRQNTQPETNVKIEGLTANFYKLKVIFEDAALGQSNFNLAIEPGTETTYIIKKNNKNAYVFRPMSMVPIAEAPPVTQGTSVVTYDAGATPYTGEETVVQETTTTTSSGMPATGGSVSFGMNVSENGGSINMNVSGFEDTEVVEQTTTVTTTTTTTSSSGYATPPPPPPPAYLPGYNGAIGCPVPMMPQDFESMKSSINSKTFEESKMTIAKQILNNNCLLSGQVREIMMLFTFEDSRLDFAKYAYGRTYDIGNYYKVNDAFTFESSIEDLDSYISSFRR
ncbi:MAG: DUF4476 domain-containing protein [Bacteroidetes bacterium]|nr:DUF4476 domain-containing protein [Bacteroidota bacterium]MBK8413301.1 DUF4476 domain-containing protein [Bacteroidota bacterium]MBK9046214.1 DUF4476 domain-containing protein [Bacteroidota bacterium]MBK9424798.1 DUF4476 domain-containing protein [Bacteroidota bacterium]MBL0070672.1 DUF4476 domain-containing protein [Bacteroidota bacterium]